ncbi:5-keto-4-deoxy-D-glucarate aldolase [compost metagenome]
MRYPTGFDREEPEILEAIQHILSTANAHGIKAALHCGSPAYALRALQWGFDMVTLANDVRMLTNAAGAALKQVRSGLGDLAGTGQPVGSQY